ncbi:hypothetical protein TVNIR_0495 [Thioalkalivibrio nitratireducens DSM 14787]|uniref:Uncharacterized protein n=1 Tax=Thioalkalivibrio nitratireducens (strain DSM 14787 / UNIQEM 213 / ALEN2) TaxID=1255043 RepID=L0DT77_THIND|nr:hypothetical protein TVNIR_0495 [Thioalkalivibrio nitratireducens DSM 14787]
MLLASLALAGSLLHAALPRAEAHTQHAPMLVRDLGLTGLALFTEARYTRHLGLGDRHAAFRDHPMALEHFPSGSLLPPPRHLHD